MARHYAYKLWLKRVLACVRNWSGEKHVPIAFVSSSDFSINGAVPLSLLSMKHPAWAVPRRTICNPRLVASECGSANFFVYYCAHCALQLSR